MPLRPSKKLAPTVTCRRSAGLAIVRPAHSSGRLCPSPSASLVLLVCLPFLFYFSSFYLCHFISTSPEVHFTELSNLMHLKFPFPSRLSAKFRNSKPHLILLDQSVASANNPQFVTCTSNLCHLFILHQNPLPT